MCPSRRVQESIKGKMQARMRAATVLTQARDTVHPAISVSRSLWVRIAASIHPVPATLWDRLRDALRPADDLEPLLWQRILRRLEPISVPPFFSKPLKLVAALAVLILVMRMSPTIFFAPPTVAKASVNVFPIRGQVSILRGGLWQPLTGELIMYKPATLQTGEGEATVVFYDDAVVRLGPHTIVAINGFADRPKVPVAASDLTLRKGDLWVMGLVPRDLPGIAVGTNEGRVVVNEGSVALHQDDPSDTAAGRAGITTIDVWHRGVTVERRGSQTTLLAGQHMALTHGESPAVTKIAASAYDQVWVSGNLSRDAVHQREIAHMQQERRAAAAGILPGSDFYPAKRFAEAVDVLLTFDAEGKAKKLLSQANTRLNEAAALLSRGSGSAAVASLQEYRDTLLAVASGSGDVVAMTTLVAQEASEASADVSAALPDDSGYALKQIVRETIAALPDDGGSKPNPAADLLDQLSAVKHRAEEGDTELARLEFEQLKETMAAPSGLTEKTLSPEERSEVEATLTSVATVIEAGEPVIVVDTSPTLVERRAMEMARRAAASSAASSDKPHRSPEQLAEEAQQIYNRVMNIYQTNQGQVSQMRLELHRVQSDPDRGKVLRKLSLLVSTDDLKELVKSQLLQMATEQEKSMGTECVNGEC